MQKQWYAGSGGNNSKSYTRHTEWEHANAGKFTWRGKPNQPRESLEHSIRV